MPVTSTRRMHPQTRKRHQGAAPQTPGWNWVAMGQMGLTGWTKVAAKPLARAIARRTGRPEAQILALIYYPGCEEVPESVAVNIRNRSYAISAQVTIDTAGAAGVLFAHGCRFGGHALYVKDGKLKYVYNYVGEFEQIVESGKPVPAGDCVLSASFEKSGTGMPTEGMLSLYINQEKVGEQKIKTQPAKFSLAGEGLNVGLDRAEPVTDDYPGTSPWAFTGGTIHKVIVDVAGDPWVDLEKEVRAAFARD